jgi:PAS domain S-box-containing protein
LAPYAVLISSFALQLVAAALAISLIRVTGQRLAWGMVAAAMALMGLRRAVTIYDVAIAGAVYRFDLRTELVALAISVLFAGGMVYIAPFFKSMRRNQDALRDSQVALAEAQRIARVGSWEWNVQTGRVWWSDEHYRIFGLEPGSAPPSYYLFLNSVHPDDRERIEFELDAARQARRPYDLQFRIIRPDGAVRDMDAQGGMIFDAKGMPVRMRGTIQDVTERKKVADELVNRERHFRALIENAPDMILLISPDSTITFASPSIERILGFKTVDMVGRKGADFVHPEDAATLREVHERVNVSPGHCERSQMRFRHADGSWHILESVFNNLLDDPAVGAIVINCRDVTDRVATEAQLRQAQRMEAVGQLTGGIAHDFNNLLAVVLGNLEVLEERVADDPALSALVRPATRAAERGAQLTGRLLAFSRKQALQPRVVNANELISGMTELLSRTLGASVSIETVGGAGLWPCEADPGQLETAILNLAINARDAMPEGGKLTIETANARLDDDYAAAQADVLPGHYVSVTVTDTGCGMPPQVLKHAFEPFFTTKEVGQGTGLGLSMVYGFVKQSGGHVTIYSEVGRGTTVRLYLPRLRPGTKADAPGAKAEQNCYARGETVLVVEDDPDVRSLAVTLLADLGYRVLEAGTGSAALDLLKENPCVNLLLTDVILPGKLSGPRLSEEAEKISPGIKVVYMSGYTEKAFDHQGELAPGRIMLQKPFRRAELACKLREALDPDHAN